MCESGRLFFLSHRAPIVLGHRAAPRRRTRTVGGLARVLEDALEKTGGSWIALGAASGPETLAPEYTGLRYPIRNVRLHDASAFHAGFGNQVLWPLCHMFPDRCRFQPAFWAAHRRANEAFAAAVQAVADPRDAVWVDDFHLCLVPGLLRDAGRCPRIGFFWHIPFPPASLFGICPWREQLLRALLGADVLAFQTDDDARNFIDCLRHFLGLSPTDDRRRLRLPERDVDVAVLPVGIDAGYLREQAASPIVRTRAADLRAALGAEVVILGVDRLDYAKGIPERLVGFERFLERHPEWRRRVSFVQITVPPQFHLPDEREMKRTIDEMVGRILGRYTYEGRAPLAYLYTALDRDRLAAYYLAADVALVTPLRDGMSLVAKEYVACHTDRDGVLVLSEFAGAARELRDALLINPYDPEAIQTQLDAALDMPPAERHR